MVVMGLGVILTIVVALMLILAVAGEADACEGHCAGACYGCALSGVSACGGDGIGRSANACGGGGRCSGHGTGSFGDRSAGSCINCSANASHGRGAGASSLGSS